MKATPVDFLLAMDQHVINVMHGLDALGKSVAAANDVKAADIAAAQLPSLLDTVKAQLPDVDGLDETAVADRLAANLTARLAS